MIEYIEINNFRSFCPLKVNLGNFNVFVGANAVGKSNFVDAFRFLRDSLKEKLRVAIEQREGFEGVCCRLTDGREDSEVFFLLRGSPPFAKIRRGEKSYSALSFQYDLRFRYHRGGYEVSREEARLYGKTPNTDTSDEFSSFQRDPKKVILQDPALPSPGKLTLRVPREYKERLLLDIPVSAVAVAVTTEIEGWRIYNPDPNEARKPQKVQETVHLSETADNLSLVLRQLREKGRSGKEIRSKIVETMRTLVPGFLDWEPKLFLGTVSYLITEKPIPEGLSPSLVSDGTIRLLSLLAALLYTGRDKPSVLFIEEPERNLHPLVLGELVELMREVSKDVQIVVTTHSPDFVRYCLPEEVFLMDKREGVTRVVPAGETERIKEFLEKFTLDQLWLSGYLEAGLP